MKEELALRSTGSHQIFTLSCADAENQMALCNGLIEVFLMKTNQPQKIQLRNRSGGPLAITRFHRQRPPVRSVLHDSHTTQVGEKDTIYVQAGFTKFEVIKLQLEDDQTTENREQQAPKDTLTTSTTKMSQSEKENVVLINNAENRKELQMKKDQVETVDMEKKAEEKRRKVSYVDAKERKATKTTSSKRKRNVIIESESESESEVGVPNNVSDKNHHSNQKSNKKIIILDDSDEDNDAVISTANKNSIQIIDDDEENIIDEIENDEDDIFNMKVDKAKQEPNEQTKSVDWMLRFGSQARYKKIGQNKTESKYYMKNKVQPQNKVISGDNGWISTHHLKKTSNPDDVSVVNVKKRRKEVIHDKYEEDRSEKDSEYNDIDEIDSTDHVKEILDKCSVLSVKLRTFLFQWQSNASNTKEDQEGDHIALTAINKTAGSGGIVTMDDIDGLSPSLVLKDYQLVGINWLHLLYQHKVSGILADEMGLGKTVQTIAFLTLLKTIHAKKQLELSDDEKHPTAPHLILVPASVLANWVREFEKFTFSNHIKVEVYYGKQQERYDFQDSFQPYVSYLNRNRPSKQKKKGRLSKPSSVCPDKYFDVLLTTYTYFERDSCGDDRSFIKSIPFTYLVLDEGHNMKNARNNRYQRICMLNVKYRLILSGTPFQNNLKELLSMMSFLMPKLFPMDSLELLWEYFEDDNIEHSRVNQIRQFLSPFILKREKFQVLNQLVPKTEVVEKLTLKPRSTQKIIYDDVICQVKKWKESQNSLNSKTSKKLKEIAAKSDLSKKQKQQQRKLAKLAKMLGTTSPEKPTKDSEKQIAEKHNAYSKQSIFTNLRKAANHPLLLRHHYQEESVIKEIARNLHGYEVFGRECTLEMVEKELKDYSDFDIHELCAQYGKIYNSDVLQGHKLPISILLNSVKFDFLRKEIPNLVNKQQKRLLIFSQWTKLLDLLEVLVGEEGLGFRFLRLDGSTEVPIRQSLIDQFNTDRGIPIFLLSTRAGGLGINLTAADTVILHDLDFNPANDRQACDRCHRIGQTKPVTVYKLVTDETVDEQIYNLSERKTLLNEAIFIQDSKGNLAKSNSTIPSATVEDMLNSVLSQATR